MRKKTNNEIYYEIRLKDFLENRISFCHWSGRNILKLKIVNRTNLIFEALNNKEKDFYLKGLVGIIKVLKRQVKTVVGSTGFYLLILTIVLINIIFIIITGVVNNFS